MSSDSPALERARQETRRGGALSREGRLVEAEAAFAAAAALAPELPEAQFNLAIARQAIGALDAATTALYRALALRPGYAEARHGLADLLIALRRYDAAAAVLGDDPAPGAGTGRLWQALGAALVAAGRPGEAAASLAAAVRLDPGNADRHGNLGLALLEDGRFAAAAAALAEAAALAPDAGRLVNLGIALRCTQQLDAAVAAFDRALALDPDHAAARFNRAMVDLTRGAFDRGWRDYEARWQVPPLSLTTSVALPRWSGEAFAGRTLVLQAEQGFGDTIQFCRFVPAAAALGGRIRLLVPPPLTRLLARSFGALCCVEDRVGVAGDELGCPLLSLPRALGTTPDGIPAAPYLHADPERAADWRRTLDAAGPGRRVGLVWAGAAASARENLSLARRRSLALADLVPVLAVPGVRFVSLQLGAAAAEARAVPDLLDWTDRLADFDDTAALIDGLDLVITVDTAVAHLAGALGRPVWLLDRFDHCWRWLAGRRDSPWYPTMRIFRQPRPGDWPAVVAEVAAALVAW